MIDGIDLNRIQDEQIRELIVRLMNLIEQQATVIRDLQIKNQELRDEINRLKGEQGKPNIKGKKRKPDGAPNHSSEKERRSRPRSGVGWKRCWAIHYFPHITKGENN
jgi:hypothetical protein